MNKACAVTLGVSLAVCVCACVCESLVRTGLFKLRSKLIRKYRALEKGGALPSAACLPDASCLYVPHQRGLHHKYLNININCTPCPRCALVWAHKRQQPEQREYPEKSNGCSRALRTSYSMCCPCSCPFHLYPTLSPPPSPFGLFYAEGAALATKRSHRSGSDWSRAGFDVISVCLLVVPPALVVALCPLPLWHYFNNEATVRPRSHSSLAPCPLKVLFFSAAASAHGQSTRNGMSHSCVCLGLCLCIASPIRWAECWAQTNKLTH